MAEIKNIIFDLGAVLIDIDFNRVNNSFLDLGISNFNNQYSQLLANKLFKKTYYSFSFYTYQQVRVESWGRFQPLERIEPFELFFKPQTENTSNT